jgi:amino acid transporter
LTPTGTALAQNRIGTAAVIVFVWCAATPLTVVAGIVTTGYAVTGHTAMPAAFILNAVVLLVFCVGFTTMGQHVKQVGGLYAYVAQGLGRPMGVGAAWIALVSYNALQIALYGAIGSATGWLVVLVTGVDLTWWLIAGACWLLVGALGLANIVINQRVLAVLLLAEIGVLVLFGLADITQPANGFALHTLSPTHLLGVGFGANMALAFLGSVGFEAVASFARVMKDPVKTMRRATYGSVAFIGALYAFSSWAMIVAVGEGQIVAQATDQGVELIFNLAGSRLGTTVMTVGMVLFATSVLAAMISFHNLVSRVMFSLGLERVLPAWLGRENRAEAPSAASLTQSALGLLVIVGYTVGPWTDPLVHLFYFGGAIGGVGVLILVLLTAVAVVGYFAADRRGESLWRVRLMPILAVVLLTGVTYAVLDNVAILLGVPGQHVLVWGVRLAFAVILTLGAAYAGYLRWRRPQVYAAIGLGADAGTAPRIPTPREPTHSRATRPEAKVR